MRLLAALGCVLVALLVITTATAGGIGVADASSGPLASTDADEFPLDQHTLGPDHAALLGAVDLDVENATEPVLVMDVQLRESGDADWTVTVWLSLEDDGDARAFERLAEEFERGTGDATISITAFETAAADSAAATERSMEIANVTRTTSATNATGSLTLEFTWTAFAQVDRNAIRLGDVFETDRGSWLPTLEDGQHLVIHAPDGYAVDSATTPVREGTMHVEGPTTLGPGAVTSVYVPSSNGAISPTPTPTPTPPTDADSTVALLLVSLLGVAVVGAVALLTFARWRRVPIPALLPTRVRRFVGSRAAAGDAPARADHARDDREPELPDAPPTSVEVDDPADVEGAFADVDLELLSDEERVVHLLEHNGGRMKQATIVKETDWSNAKVSQLLSSMAEEGTVDKLRIGRENLITLVDSDGEVDATVGDQK